MTYTPQEETPAQQLAIALAVIERMSRQQDDYDLTSGVTEIRELLDDDAIAILDSPEVQAVVAHTFKSVDKALAFAETFEDGLRGLLEDIFGTAADEEELDDDDRPIDFYPSFARGFAEGRDSIGHTKDSYDTAEVLSNLFGHVFGKVTIDK